MELPVIYTPPLPIRCLTRAILPSTEVGRLRRLPPIRNAERGFFALPFYACDHITPVDALIHVNESFLFKTAITQRYPRPLQTVPRQNQAPGGQAGASQYFAVRQTWRGATGNRSALTVEPTNLSGRNGSHSCHLINLVNLVRSYCSTSHYRPSSSLTRR